MEIGPQKNIDFSTLIGCHGNVPWDIGKRAPAQLSALKTLSVDVKYVKIAKIGPVDPEIIVLWEIIKKKIKKRKKIYSPTGKFAERAKKELNASTIYSPVGKCAERAKKMKKTLAKYIARWAGIPGWLNYYYFPPPAVIQSILMNMYIFVC